MGLLGARSIAELAPSFLARVEPRPRRNWIESAFPLLAEGYGGTAIGDLGLRLPGEQ